MVVQVDDRRIFDRFTARFPVKFQNSRDSYGSNVFLRDFSADGAKIVTKRTIFINDSIDLVIELPDGHDPLTVSGKIVWAKKTNPASWDAGLKFDRVKFMQTQRVYKFCQ